MLELFLIALMLTAIIVFLQQPQNSAVVSTLNDNEKGGSLTAVITNPAKKK